MTRVKTSWRRCVWTMMASVMCVAMAECASAEEVASSHGVVIKGAAVAKGSPTLLSEPPCPVPPCVGTSDGGQ